MPTTAPSPGRHHDGAPAVRRESIRDVPGLAELAQAQAVRVGTHVFVSGQLALDHQGEVVGADDCYAQAVRCFRNVEAILQAAGGQLSDVVKVTCYLTDVADAAAYAEARSQFLDHSTATTAVVVKKLLLPEALLELDVTAVLSSAANAD